MRRKLFRIIVATLVMPNVAYAGDCFSAGGAGCVEERPAADCGGGAYDVTFAVAGDALVGALQVAVNYGDVSGELVGSGQTAACKAKVDGLSVFADKDSVRTLKAGVVVVEGFEAPSEVITCRFEAIDRAPTVSDFSIRVEDAATPEGVKISPLPSVKVSSIVAAGGQECGRGPVCGNGAVEDGEECDDGDANGDGPSACSAECEVQVDCGDSDGNGTVNATDGSRALRQAVGLTGGCSTSVCDVNESGSVTASDARLILDASVGRAVALRCNPVLTVTLDDLVELGGIELTIDYSSAADAAFAGDGEGVSCVSLIDGAVAAFNDDSGARLLHVALVALPSIDGPVPLFACKFSPGSASADDLVVRVDDAISPSYETLPPPEVSVSW